VAASFELVCKNGMKHGAMQGGADLGSCVCVYESVSNLESSRRNFELWYKFKSDGDDVLVKLSAGFLSLPSLGILSRLVLGRPARSRRRETYPSAKACDLSCDM
jgi:hypothetical protein